VVQAILVEQNIEDGKKLIDALEAVNFRIQMALWLYDSESQVWRLNIATPLVDERGSRYAYTDIQGVLKSIVPPLSLSLQDISVISTENKLVKSLKKAIRVPYGLQGIRLTRNTINSIYIEDAYIYSTRAITKIPAA